VSRGGPSGLGGRRPGAGRKPSTVEGILKRLPKELAELLTREIKAKAELIMVEINLRRLTNANLSSEFPETAIGAKTEVSMRQGAVQGATTLTVGFKAKSLEEL
jgi:hypothetical protein